MNQNNSNGTDLFADMAVIGETKGKRGRPRKERVEGEVPSKCKQSLYLSTEVVERAEALAKKNERSLSWVFRKAFELAEAELNALPTSSGSDDIG